MSNDEKRSPPGDEDGRQGGRAPGPAHAEAFGAVLARLDSGPDGLSAVEAERRLRENGPNLLPEKTGEPAWRRFLAQFMDPLVLTLLVAAAIAVVVGASGVNRGGGSWLSRYADAMAILLIVILNAFIGYFQEARAEAALKALQKMAAPLARVRRGVGDAVEVMQVNAAEIVVGDVLELGAGDAVPADARLLQSLDLTCEESALTGESLPIHKDANAHLDVDAALGDRTTMVYSGTVVVRGRGRAVVCATGADTQLGRIGALIASIVREKTALEQRLEKFGKTIIWVCLGLSAVLMLWGFARPALFGGMPRPWHELLLEAVALAVAAIPEGLPAITTITLALGMQRMARRGAIVRKLPAVETLGAATVICSDKTGTLTQNEMTVRAAYVHGRYYQVTGEGYSPEGRIVDDEGRSVGGDELSLPFEQLLATAALCNNAKLVCATAGDDAGRDDGGREGRCWRVVGDPTEGALLTLVNKAGRSLASIRASHEFVSEWPFDSDRKRMSVVTRRIDAGPEDDADSRDVIHVKGGLDAILRHCVNIAGDDGPYPLTDDIRATIRQMAETMSGRALRVLAFGRREGHSGDRDSFERDLTFLGLVGMMDPPRVGVREAVETCAAAGIRAVMITGDHKLTATAIADEIHLWEPGDKAITGRELAAMSDEELTAEIMNLRVFARVTAAQKLRIVRAFKRAGHVVAMTGDGVNDAPALRESNIGVAMGKMGTDVTRQAADLVLADDNFTTIVDAVREGRAIYRNIQKFIFFLLSANMGLVVSVFTISFFRDWPPLTPLMLLWINLVTNGLVALALGVDPPNKGLMEEMPRPVKEGLMVFRDYLGIIYVGSIMGAAAVILYLISAQDPESLAHTRAMAFSALAFSPLIHALSCRSPTLSAFGVRPLVSLPLVGATAASALIHLVAVLVPAMQPIFHTFPMTAEQWILIVALAAIVLPAVELAKLVDYLRARRRRRPRG